MPQNDKLNVDEVICLQISGLSTTDILRIDLDTFDSLYEDNPKFGEYLSQTNNMLDRQEALGITTISVYDMDFPRRLLEIGEECPAVIYSLGNLELLKKEQAVAIIGARAGSCLLLATAQAQPISLEDVSRYI